MNKTQKRILFLRAHRSVRELMATSLLTAYEGEQWDIWIASARFLSDEIEMVCHVLDEIHIPLIAVPQMVEPTVDLSWDEGIVLCSGATDQ